MDGGGEDVEVDNVSKTTSGQFYITCPVGIGLGCISKWLGWILTIAPQSGATVGIHPNRFKVLNVHPNRIPTKIILRHVV